MTPFEQYAQSRNEQPSEITFEVGLFNVWLVQSGNMPKTEREVEAMRKAWAAAWEQHNDLFFDALKPTIEEYHALKRLRDDLRETTNRYLERARKAEAEAAFNAEAWKRAEERLQVSNPFGDFKTELDKLEGAFDPSSSIALYLQQFGRVLRPGYKPPSRWQRFKFWLEDVREWLGDFPR